MPRDNSNNVPPPLKKLTLLKLKTQQLLSQSKKTVKRLLTVTASASVAASVLGFLVVKGPEVHGLYLRQEVGSKVYMIKGRLDGGGGTGFSIEAPSGQTYIVTNSHVCEGALTQSQDKTSLLVVNDYGRIMRRRILEISDFTDLCILEGLPGVKGLKLADSNPYLGESLYAVGHPMLHPLSVSKGEIVGQEDAVIVDSEITSQEDLAKCSAPKNRIQDLEVDFFGLGITRTIKLCLVITSGAYVSTIVIFPGNSGSPIVDALGNVSGVAFAADKTNYAAIVSLNDLKTFIARY